MLGLRHVGLRCAAAVCARWGCVAAAVVLSVAVLPSCGNSSSSRHASPGNDEEPARITGVPAGYDADDLAFANNMIVQREQAIKISALAPEHSAAPGVIAFEADNRPMLESDVATLRALRVQWIENPDIKTNGGGSGAVLSGMADPETVARLNSLHGSDFDQLWLRSRLTMEQGGAEMALAETRSGKNRDALRLAHQMVETQHANIGRLKQLLRS